MKNDQEKLEFEELVNENIYYKNKSSSSQKKILNFLKKDKNLRKDFLLQKQMHYNLLKFNPLYSNLSFKEKVISQIRENAKHNSLFKNEIIGLKKNINLYKKTKYKFIAIAASILMLVSIILPNIRSIFNNKQHVQIVMKSKPNKLNSSSKKREEIFSWNYTFIADRFYKKSRRLYKFRKYSFKKQSSNYTTSFSSVKEKVGVLKKSLKYKFKDIGNKKA